MAPIIFSLFHSLLQNLLCFVKISWSFQAPSIKHQLIFPIYELPWNLLKIPHFSTVLNLCFSPQSSLNLWYPQNFLRISIFIFINLVNWVLSNIPHYSWEKALIKCLRKSPEQVIYIIVNWFTRKISRGRWYIWKGPCLKWWRTFKITWLINSSSAPQIHNWVSRFMPWDRRLFVTGKLLDNICQTKFLNFGGHCSIQAKARKGFVSCP